MTMPNAVRICARALDGRGLKRIREDKLGDNSTIRIVTYHDHQVNLIRYRLYLFRFTTKLTLIDHCHVNITSNMKHISLNYSE